MGDVALPESPDVAADVARYALGVRESRMPAEGSVAEDPAGGVRWPVVIVGIVLLILLLVIVPIVVVVVLLLRRSQLAVGEEIFEMGWHLRRLAMSTVVSHVPCPALAFTSLEGGFSVGEYCVL